MTQFQVGDEVFGESGYVHLLEYACVSEAMLGHKPTNLSFAEAAAVPVAGVTALQGNRDHSGIQPGQTVLINGASGGVGTYAVQIAKAYGAEVTAGLQHVKNRDGALYRSNTLLITQKKILPKTASDMI